MSVQHRPRCRSCLSRDVGLVSAEMSVAYQPRCWLSIGRDVGRVSAEVWVEYQPTCRSSIGRDVGRVSAEMSVEFQRDVGQVCAEMSVEYPPRCRSSISIKIQKHPQDEILLSIPAKPRHQPSLSPDWSSGGRDLVRDVGRVLADMWVEYQRRCWSSVGRDGS